MRCALDDRIATTGVVLCGQIKALDMSVRNALFKEKSPQDIMEEIIDIIYGSIEL